MLVTEEEAWERWCPFARVSVFGEEAYSPTHNRVNMEGERQFNNPKSARCIASQCMAWTWSHYGKWRGGVGPSPLEGETDEFDAIGPGGWVRNHYGFCGLAGKPE